MTLTCDSCGTEFEARANARYCSGRCRTIAYRERKDGPRPKHRRIPLRDTLDRTEWNLLKQVERLERVAADDRIKSTIKQHPRYLIALRRHMERLQRVIDQLDSYAD